MLSGSELVAAVRSKAETMPEVGAAGHWSGGRRGRLTGVGGNVAEQDEKFGEGSLAVVLINQSGRGRRPPRVRRRRSTRRLLHVATESVATVTASGGDAGDMVERGGAAALDQGNGRQRRW